MDKKKLNLFEVEIMFDKIFADHYAEAVERLKGDGFFTPSPYIPECPLWLNWELNQNKDGSWRFKGSLRAESLSAAREAVDKTMPRGSAAWLYRSGLRITKEFDDVNDSEFVRIVIDGEPATYSYKFEVEQRFVLDHTDELSLPENELRWWRNHGVTDANIGDWQMHEAFLVYKIREGEAFADLIK